MLKIDASALDYAIIAIYFAVVLGIGFAARKLIKDDADFFLSGRSLPAWITGLAFIAANLGALEILGMAANGAQYGVATVHFYWLGAIPAMVFLGLVMMPFYYGSKIRSVPEYLRRRYGNEAHLFNALSFAVATVLIGAFPKLFIPLLVVIPGLVALVTVKGFGTGSADIQQYNNAIPALMAEYLPNGMLGLAVTALIASFMAGVAANVSAFNTVVTYDLYQDYIRGDAGDRHYIWFGRIMTVVGILISIGTAFIAKGYENIMNYVQLLFSYFNAPLFATFVIGLFWKRATRWGGIAGLVAGTLGAFLTHLLYSKGTISFGSPLAADFWGAIVAFSADAIVTVVVSLATQPRRIEDLQGLVWGMAEVDPDADLKRPWWQRPVVLAVIILALAVILNIIFI